MLLQNYDHLKNDCRKVCGIIIIIINSSVKCSLYLQKVILMKNPTIFLLCVVDKNKFKESSVKYLVPKWNALFLSAFDWWMKTSALNFTSPSKSRINGRGQIISAHFIHPPPLTTNTN